MTIPTDKKPRNDSHLSGLAGELFVAAELLKRDVQTSITFGNTKSIDLLAYNARTKRAFVVQVKTLRRKSTYPISPARVNADHTYVFVLLNEPGQAVEYFIVHGSTMRDEPDRFGKWFQNPTFSGIRPKDLSAFADNWQLFEQEAKVDGRTRRRSNVQT